MEQTPLALGAASAGNRLDNLGLFSVLILYEVADEDEAVVTAVWPLQTGVVGVEGVVVYSGGVHWGPFPLGRAPGCANTCGAVSYLTPSTLPQVTTNSYKYGRIFPVNYGAMEVNVETLKELRINAGLSQRELAIRAGLTPGAVWQVEHRGSGSPATLKKVADVLGVRPVDLLEEGR